MKTLIILILMGFGGLVHAEGKPENWFCLDESGKRDGDFLLACGVGEGPSESLARADGLREAMNEFRTICQASVDCNMDQVMVEPKRMTCTHTGGAWKCYRLIEVVMIHKALEKGQLATHAGD